MLIRNVEIPGFAGGPPGLTNVRLGARIEAVGDLELQPGERVVEGDGGALLPGLHDHHIHMFSLAAARASVDCGPDRVLEQVVADLRAVDGEWVRGINYHESLAGDLTAADIDTWVPDRPVRIQHRSGIVWYLNSAALAEVGARAADLPGIERGSDGAPNGRLFRLDHWLGHRVASRAQPDLSTVSAELARYGVTGITDATHTNDAAQGDVFAQKFASGELLQSARLMSGPPLLESHAGLSAGEHKVMLDEYELPSLDDLVMRIRRAHDEESRGVAIHCVTRIELLFAMAALREAGATAADRLEHASVVPHESIAQVAALGVTVVSQPSLVYTRGDRYLMDVPAADHKELYRARTLMLANVPYGASSDAPYGDLDPWLAAAAAVSRLTASGAALGRLECLEPEAALCAFLGRPDDPGGPARQLRPRAPADICLLDRSWASARANLSEVKVVLTLRGGDVIFVAKR